MPSSFQVPYPNVQIAAPKIDPAADLQKLVKQIVLERQRAAALAARAQNQAARQAEYDRRQAMKNAEWDRRFALQQEARRKDWEDKHTSTHTLYDPSTNETRTVDIIARNEKAAAAQVATEQQRLNDNYRAARQAELGKELAGLESLDVGRQDKQLKALIQAEANQIAQMSGAPAEVKKKLLEDTAAQFSPYRQQISERKKAIADESSIGVIGKELGMAGGRLLDAVRGFFDSPQEQIARAQAREASNRATIESSPYLADQLKREQAGEGWWERGSGDTGSRILNVGRTVAGIAPELAATIGAGMLSGGALSGVGLASMGGRAALAAGGRAAATAARAANIGRVAGSSLGMGAVGAVTAPGSLAEAILARNPQASQEQLEQMQEAGQGISRVAGGVSNALFLPSIAGVAGAWRGARQGIREGGLRGAASGAIRGVEEGILAKAAATEGQSAIRRALGAAPLSMTEGGLLTGGFQLGQNIAYNRKAPGETKVPWYEGVPEAALGGALLGGALGSARDFVEKRDLAAAKRASREKAEQALAEAEAPAATPKPEQAPAPATQKPALTPEQLDFLIRDAEGTGIGSYDRMTTLGMKPDDAIAAVEASSLPDGVKSELYDAHTVTRMVADQTGDIKTADGHTAEQLGVILRPIVDRFKEIAANKDLKKVADKLSELQTAVAEFKQNNAKVPDIVIDAVLARSTLAGKDNTPNKTTHPLYAAALTGEVTTSSQALNRSTLLKAYRNAQRKAANAYFGSGTELRQTTTDVREQANGGQSTPGQSTSGGPEQIQRPVTPMAGNVPAAEGATGTASGNGPSQVDPNSPASPASPTSESASPTTGDNSATLEGGLGGKPQPDNGSAAQTPSDAQTAEPVSQGGPQREGRIEEPALGTPESGNGAGKVIDEGGGPAGDNVNAEALGEPAVTSDSPTGDNVISEPSAASIVRSISALGDIEAIRAQIDSLQDVLSLNDLNKQARSPQRSGEVFVASLNKSVNAQMQLNSNITPVEAVTKYLDKQGFVTPTDLVNMALALAKAGKDKEARLVADAYRNFENAGSDVTDAVQAVASDPTAAVCK